MIAGLMALALHSGYIVRTNVPGLYHKEFYLGAEVVLPKATIMTDYWFTARYYDTCGEESHINSRIDETVTVKLDKVVEGKCDQ